VILGMHRSGTSLVTRLVSLLGLAVCRDSDLLVGYKGNPRGHWESRSLIDFDDRLLEELGGTWFCPPLLGERETSRTLDRHGAEALHELEHAHPRHPWVWKDPRACVLMPFWSAVLGPRAAYVLVVRHPFEVSESLARRNGCTSAFSLALWERYTREALLGAAGRPMIVSTYDGVLADPVGWCERLIAFLAELGLTLPPVDWDVLGAYAMDGLRHSRRSWEELGAGPSISTEQVALARAVSVFTAQSSYVPPQLPAETPETESTFAEIRRLIAPRSSERRNLLVELPAHLQRAPQPQPGSVAESRPPVSVVLAGGAGSDPDGTIERLLATLPARSEVVLVGAERALAGALAGAREVSLRNVVCATKSSAAEALALGAREARGEIVMLACDAALRWEGWHGPAKRALARIQIAAVCPVMRFDACPELRHFGRVFADDDLASLALAAEHSEPRVPVALLPESLCAYDRRVLAAAGGVDGEFDSARGAVAELSVRLWRMGFQACALTKVEAWGEGPRDRIEQEPGGLHDRMRLATLHFGAERLQAFLARAGRLPGYAAAAERLAASDVERRRVTIAATCAFPIDRYFRSFPPAVVTP
jgi:hypothetical protein